MTVLRVSLVIMGNALAWMYRKKKFLNLWRKHENKNTLAVCLKFVIKAITLLYITRCLKKRQNKYGIIRHVL